MRTWCDETHGHQMLNANLDDELTLLPNQIPSPADKRGHTRKITRKQHRHTQGAHLVFPIHVPLGGRAPRGIVGLKSEPVQKTGTALSLVGKGYFDVLSSPRPSTSDTARWFIFVQGRRLHGAYAEQRRGDRGSTRTSLVLTAFSIRKKPTGGMQDDRLRLRTGWTGVVIRYPIVGLLLLCATPNQAAVNSAPMEVHVHLETYFAKYGTSRLVATHSSSSGETRHTCDSPSFGC